MILHLDHFIKEERPYWDELEKMLEVLEKRAEYQPSMDTVRRLYYLYRRVASDLDFDPVSFAAFCDDLDGLLDHVRYG